MIPGKWWTSALLGILFSIQASAQERSACQLDRFSTLPITTLPDGRYSVPATLGDHSLTFLLDTGGAIMELATDQATSLGLRVFQSNRVLLGVGGQRESDYTVGKNFSLGRLQGPHILFYTRNRLPPGIDGVLAPDILDHYDVDIDPAHGNINLFSPKHCAGKVVYWTGGSYVVLPISVNRIGQIYIQVTLDGKKFRAQLDTGSISSSMTMAAAKALDITEETPNLKLLTAKDAVYKDYYYPFKLLDFDGITVTNPDISVVSNNYFPNGSGFDSVDMIIGVSILRRLHLYIAYGEQKLYITPATQN